MKLLLIIAIVLIAACSHNVKPEIKPIDRPVYCAKPIDRIKYKTEELDRSIDPYTKVIYLLVEIRQRDTIEDRLRAELKGCQKPVGEEPENNN